VTKATEHYENCGEETGGWLLSKLYVLCLLSDCTESFFIWLCLRVSQLRAIISPKSSPVALALAHRRLSSSTLLVPCFPFYPRILLLFSLTLIYDSVGVSDRARPMRTRMMHTYCDDNFPSFSPSFLGASTVQVESRYNGETRAFDTQYTSAFYFHLSA